MPLQQGAFCSLGACLDQAGLNVCGAPGFAPAAEPSIKTQQPPQTGRKGESEHVLAAPAKLLPRPAKRPQLPKARTTFPPFNQPPPPAPPGLDSPLPTHPPTHPPLSPSLAMFCPEGFQGIQTNDVRRQPSVKASARQQISLIVSNTQPHRAGSKSCSLPGHTRPPSRPPRQPTRWCQRGHGGSSSAAVSTATVHRGELSRLEVTKKKKKQKRRLSPPLQQNVDPLL